MSELTQCNCCSLAEIRRQAKKDGMKVFVVADPYHNYGGAKSVYVVPKGIGKTNAVAMGDVYKRSWMAETTKECVC